MRASGDPAFADAVYHMGKCITDPEDLRTIMSNVTTFYKCKREVF